MRKFLSVNLIIALSLLCGCTQSQENISETRFLMDTVVKISARCDRETLNGAFSLCEAYEKIFSARNKKSELYSLNNGVGEQEVSAELLELIELALQFCEKSEGRYDITIAPVSELYDFEGVTLPDRGEIAEALKSVDYEAIEIKGNRANLNSAKIDLGSIAKGYIADKIAEYFYENGVAEGIINLGGNVRVLNERDYSVGIKDPRGDGNIAELSVRDMSVVTSGVYERYIEVDGKRYHHILDPKTGYSADTDLLSATIIGKNGASCDALSTISILYGLDKARALIENTEGYEAIFVDKNGRLHYSSGLNEKNGKFTI